MFAYNTFSVIDHFLLDNVYIFLNFGEFVHLQLDLGRGLSIFSLQLFEFFSSLQRRVIVVLQISLNGDFAWTIFGDDCKFVSVALVGRRVSFGLNKSRTKLPFELAGTSWRAFRPPLPAKFEERVSHLECCFWFRPEVIGILKCSN